jgi:hypothetical protein
MKPEKFLSILETVIRKPDYKNNGEFIRKVNEAEGELVDIDATIDVAYLKKVLRGKLT